MATVTPSFANPAQVVVCSTLTVALQFATGIGFAVAGSKDDEDVPEVEGKLYAVQMDLDGAISLRQLMEGFARMNQ